MNIKTCLGCEESLPEDAFQFEKARDYLRPRCKKCEATSAKLRYTREDREKRLAYQRMWYARNREHVMAKTAEWRAAHPGVQKKYNRQHRLKKKYGISHHDYECLLAEQEGVCAICGLPPNGKVLVVDHCHNSGTVRGLLHDGCNIALGFVEKAGVEAIADYLRSQHPLPRVSP